MSDLSDDDLMILFVDGDPEAFDVLFDRCGPAVYNFAFHMLNDAAQAEEILQETFLAVARSAKSYQPQGRFRTWLMRIARNRCLNAIDSECLRQTALAESSLTGIDPPSRQAPPDEQAEANETMTRVRHALADLPTRQREALALFAFEQMTYRQIAEVLAMPINTVKTLIHRARATLAAALDDEKKEPTDGL